MSKERISSVERFKQLTRELQIEVGKEAIAELDAAADELVAQMKAVAPVGPTGNLKQSIRKEVSPKGPTRLLVKAGGALTTKKVRKSEKGNAPNYDYALGVEFGNARIQAEPFFWPSWRLRRKTIRSKMTRRIAATIKKKSAGA